MSLVTPPVLALGDSSVDVRVPPGEHPQAFGGTVGGHPDRRDLRLGVGHAGYGGQVDLAAYAEHGVAGREAAVRPGGVGELRVPGEVTCGPDPVVGGPQQAVDPQEAPLVDLHPHRLEPEARGARCPADGDEQVAVGHPAARRRAAGSPVTSGSSGSVCLSAPVTETPVSTTVPSPVIASETAAAAWGSSRGSTRGAPSTTVTCEPRRVNAWPSSQPMLPPPRTTSREGSTSRSHTVSLVRCGTWSSPVIPGTAGAAPVAITACRKVRVVSSHLGPTGAGEAALGRAAP